MIDKDELLKILPRHIREDDAIRGAIIAALCGVIATREDIKDIIREMDKRFEAVDKQFLAIDKRFLAIDKRFLAIDKRFEALQQQMDKRFEMVIQEIGDTNRNLGLLKTFLETNVAELCAGQQRVEKFMHDMSDWMQSREE